MKASQCYHYSVFTAGISHLLLTRTSFYKKRCEESMGHLCGQTLLRVETCVHHVLTGTYDKLIIIGLNCSY